MDPHIAEEKPILVVSILCNGPRGHVCTIHCRLKVLKSSRRMYVYLESLVTLRCEVSGLPLLHPVLNEPSSPMQMIVLWEGYCLPK